MKKAKGKNSGLLPNSLRIISSCLKTVSSNASTAVRSAGASVAASISTSGDDRKDQVIWAGFDKLESGPTVFRHVLLLGYHNGFQVFDVEDAANFCELVSKREGPVTFLQMLPTPAKSDGEEGFGASYPVLLVVAGDETSGLNPHNCRGSLESQSGLSINSPTAVQFYSLKSNCFLRVQRFQSAVCIVRCSPRIVAVGLETQICCIDPHTFEKKFSVLTYPVPQFGGQGSSVVNIGYGPLAVGARWLAYASDNPLVPSTGRLSPKNLYPSPGVSPSTSPGSGSLMARYAIESSKQLAAGIVNLGDVGYKTLSRYCPELHHDGPSSPVPPNSGWKSTRRGGSESENAGMVAIMDFVSRTVIAQFRAHTSPISALCFDPSGTLLVTASIHGNTINIFRIMPSCTRSGSSKGTYDWSSCHMHLYKLYRGMTTAIIQDICFSYYSQWIAIVSSKCTCHIFVISPFGGDVGFQTLNSQVEDPSLYPVSSRPWWSTSSFIINQQASLPPPPVTISVVSRIKNSSTGLLNSVTNATVSAAGMVSVPSGAVAAVFHNSISSSFQNVQPTSSYLEHLLVYTPTGQVIQYGILQSTGVGLADAGLRTRSGSHIHKQDDELRVRVEPVQWWDACRKSDRPEREESISGTTFDRQEMVEEKYGTDILDVNDKIVGERLKSHEKSHWYLSNVEVQVNSGRSPVWQNAQIRFYIMNPPRVKGCGSGEIGIENIPFHEVEIKQKDLLPVFDHFHSIKSNWNNRGLSGVKYPNASSFEPHYARYKSNEETVICHSKPASLSSTESSDGGSSRRMENLLDLEPVNIEKLSHNEDELYQERRGNATLLSFAIPSFTSIHLKNDDPHEEHPSSRTVAEGSQTPNTGGVMEAPMVTADDFDSGIGPKPSSLQNHVHFEQFYQEGYCKTPDFDGCHGSSEVITDDVDKNCGHRDQQKPEDDGENDELFGGMFFEDG